MGDSRELHDDKPPVHDARMNARGGALLVAGNALLAADGVLPHDVVRGNVHAGG